MVCGDKCVILFKLIKYKCIELPVDEVQKKITKNPSLSPQRTL
jgi:hypothetical protein